MSGVSDDIYSQIANSKASAGGNPLRDGEGLAVVRKLLIEKKHKGVMFIAEMEVIENKPVSVEPDLLTPSEKERVAAGQTIATNTVGGEHSYVVNLGKDSGPGNVKAYILGIDGTPEDQVNAEEFAAMIKHVTGKAQPFRGALVRFASFRKPIQKGANAGKPFTAFKWTHVPQTLPEMQARAAQLDAKDKAAADKQKT